MSVCYISLRLSSISQQWTWRSRALFKTSIVLLSVVMSGAGPFKTRRPLLLSVSIVDNNCHRERQRRGDISLLGGGTHSCHNIGRLNWKEHLIQLVRKSMPAMCINQRTTQSQTHMLTMWQMCPVQFGHTHIGTEWNNGMPRALRCRQIHKSRRHVSVSEMAALNILCVCDLGVLGTWRACRDVHLFNREQ